MVVNPSSTGKSYFINSILEPFRENDYVIDYTDFTTAYFKRKYENVNGLIFKIEQLESKNDNGQLSFDKIKHLMSEGVLRFGNVDKDDKGQQGTKEFEVRGIPIFFTTATSSKIDPETENRFLMMELDESQQQTENIINYTLNKVSTIKNDEKWETSKKKLAKLFKDYKKASMYVEDIQIPFANKLFTLLPKNLEIRRDLTKIIALTRIIAFINYEKRDKLQNNKPQHLITGTFGETEEFHKGIIIATVQDFEEALEIAGKTITRTINKTTQKTMDLFKFIKKLSNDKGIDEDSGVTMNEVVKSSGLAGTTVRDHIKSLTNNGFLLADYSEKEHRYYPLDKDFTKIQNNTVDFTTEEYQSWLKATVDSNPSYYFVSSQHGLIDNDLCVKQADNPTKTVIRDIPCHTEKSEGSK